MFLRRFLEIAPSWNTKKKLWGKHICVVSVIAVTILVTGMYGIYVSYTCGFIIGIFLNPSNMSLFCFDQSSYCNLKKRKDWILQKTPQVESCRSAATDPQSRAKGDKLKTETLKEPSLINFSFQGGGLSGERITTKICKKKWEE